MCFNERNCIIYQVDSVCQWPGRPGLNPRSSHAKDLKKWYLIPPCLTLSIIRYVSRVKCSNPGKGVAPSPTPWCSSYWRGKLQVANFTLLKLCKFCAHSSCEFHPWNIGRQKRKKKTTKKLFSIAVEIMRNVQNIGHNFKIQPKVFNSYLKYSINEYVEWNIGKHLEFYHLAYVEVFFFFFFFF